MTPELRDADRERLHQFRIDDTLIGLHGVKRVTSQQARLDCGIQLSGTPDLAGVAYPIWGADDSIKGYRVRRDNPEIENGKPKAKYVQSADRSHLFFERTSRQHLANISVPVIFVEAYTSALALAAWAERISRRLLIVATAGCWNWHGTIGKVVNENGVRVDEKGPSPDLDHIPFKDRHVYILFDSNLHTNALVQAATRQFTRALQERGAIVHIPALPEEANLNGPDDFLMLHSDENLAAILDAAPAANNADDDQTLRRLAALSLIEYDRAREAGADVLGVRVSTLDRLVDALRPKTSQDGQNGNGGTIVLSDPEPSTEPVDGATLADEIRDLFKQYVVLPAGAAIALTLWVLHTFLLAAAEASPIIAIVSPEKRCGKTVVLEILQCLTRRPLPAANITAAALFRTIEAYEPTLLIDEADSFLKDNEELRGVLNSGHRKASAVIIRTTGDDHEPRTFSTWCPKAIALIGKLPGTLEDRSIVIAMQRKSRTEKVKRLRCSKLSHEVEETRQRVARWAVDHFEPLQNADPAVPEDLNDRAADCWRSLLAIANRLGSDWTKDAEKAAVLLSTADGLDDSSITVQLLIDIRAIFDEQGADKLASEAIVEELRKLEERPWPEWGKNSKPITQTQLARLLAKFKVRPKNIRIGTIVKGYELDQFADAFTRYIHSAPKTDIRSATPLQPNTDEGFGVADRDFPTGTVADQKINNPKQNSDVADVAAQNPFFWREEI